MFAFRADRSQSRIRLFLLALVGVTALGACSREPTELVPLFSTIAQLPGLPSGDTGTFDMTLSNGGEKDINIASVSFAALTDHEGEEANFTDAQTDVAVIPPLGQAVVRFSYQTPNGSPQGAVLVIESDADTNPKLEIEVYTEGFIANPPADAGTTPADAGTTSSDAGTPAADSGTPTADAGTTTADAGTTSSDAGPSDSGV